MTTKEPGYSGDAIKPPVEVERKFLIDPDNIPEDLPVTVEMSLTQAYIAIAEDGSETRVRRTQTIDDEDGECELTVKSKGGLARGEWNIPISLPMFNELMPKTVGKIIEKMRLAIPHDGQTIELDIYKGELEGLVVAEVEFKNTDEADAIAQSQSFNKPDWFGKELTEDKRYKNQALAVYGLPE